MIQYSDEFTIGFSENEFEDIAIKLRAYLEKKSKGSLVEYILDFCDINSYRIEDVAEIIELDKELKYLLKQDCIFHKIFRTDDAKLDNW